MIHNLENFLFVLLISRFHWYQVMLGSPAGPGGPSQRGGLWPLAPAPAPTATNFTTPDGKFYLRFFFKCSLKFMLATTNSKSILLNDKNINIQKLLN